MTDSAQIGLFSGILGLLFGSYLSTLLVRWSSNRVLGLSRSICDNCYRELRWYELVPIIAYVIQKAKCRRCDGIISWVHPLIEILCGAVSAYFGATGFWQIAPFTCLLIVICFFDGMYFWLPNRLIIWLGILALLSPSWSPDLELAERLLGGFCGFISLWGLRLIYLRVRGREGLGAGDPKLFGALGLWLGPLLLPNLMLVACVFGLIDTFVKLRSRADWRGMRLPLGSYLTLAALVFALVLPFRDIYLRD